jgi:hypothetical protein
MKSINDMNQAELAAYVQNHLAHSHSPFSAQTSSSEAESLTHSKLEACFVKGLMRSRVGPFTFVVPEPQLLKACFAKWDHLSPIKNITNYYYILSEIP